MFTPTSLILAAAYGAFMVFLGLHLCFGSLCDVHNAKDENEVEVNEKSMLRGSVLFDIGLVVLYAVICVAKAQFAR